MSEADTPIENEILGAIGGLCTKLKFGKDYSRVRLEDKKNTVGARKGVDAIYGYDSDGAVIYILDEDDCAELGLDDWRAITKHFYDGYTRELEKREG